MIMFLKTADRDLVNTDGHAVVLVLRGLLYNLYPGLCPNQHSYVGTRQSDIFLILRALQRNNLEDLHWRLRSLIQVLDFSDARIVYSPATDAIFIVWFSGTPQSDRDHKLRYSRRITLLTRRMRRFYLP